MVFNNYIKEADGAVTIIRSPLGWGLMVDTREESPESWDAAIDACWDAGWQLKSDEPDEVVDFWEFWDMEERNRSLRRDVA